MALKLFSIAICAYLVTNAYGSQSLPTDLKSRVRFALKLEKSNAVTCDPNGKPIPCPPSKFRSPSGECNNVLNRSHGARGDVFLRLLEPDYADYHSQPRTSIGPHALPSADFVVDELQNTIDADDLHPHITAMVPAWGQLIAYDLAEFTPLTINMKCCKDNEKRTTTEEIEQCYVRYGENCLEYKRSVPSIEPNDCQFKYRNQMNLASGFIDGSSLYGATEREVNSLRLFRNGKVDIRACSRCTEAGAVGTLHTLFLKEHNRVATILSDKNPTWDDTALFLEARRAVVAELQHITYNEFLPIILGQQITNQDSLKMVFGKHYHGYSSSIRPGVFNEIATSALPAFMTMLPKGMNNESTTIETLLTASAMLKTLQPNNLDFNEYWTPIALAIHRSRDHGIPAYHKALNLCEERLPNTNGQKLTFADLQAYGGLSQESRIALESIYQNAEDVDLLAGALLEQPALGTVFGPTLSCLLSIQFAKLRSSDRFWYENDIPPSSLNLDQLNAVRRVTLAGLLCTAGGLKRSQPKAFIKEDPYLNFRQTCQQLSGLDLTAWESNDEPEFTTEKLRIEEETTAPVLDGFNESILRAAIEKAKADVNERKQFEYETWLKRGGIDARSPDGTAASFSKANRNALLIANSSLFYEFASNEILDSLRNIHRRKRQTFDQNALFGVFRDDFVNSLQNIDVNTLLTGSISPVSMEPQCEDFAQPCDPSNPFRSLTGHCNNLLNPEWGKSLTTFARLLPPVYEDGISKPRQTSTVGIPLPNPRTVSSLIHPDISNLHTRYTLMTMQFAQFLDHDLTMTPIHKGFHESIPSCRSCDSPRTVHPECNPIPIPTGDNFYPELNVTSGERMCFPFMRSLPGQLTLGPREQINQNTAFVDASHIYGENTCLCNKLRSYTGRMNSTLHPVRGKELLPQTDQHPECKSPSGYCFIAGDGRASEQPGLTAIHTIFLREHNRIVEGLRGVNPTWDNERMFQHARRIVSAQFQHIVYNEFLPRLLSWNAVNLYGLKLLPQGYYKEYDPTCNPAIVTEFAAAAFRIGHSLLRPHIPRLSADHRPIDPPLLLRDGFFKMDALMAPEMMDEISRGLVATPMETLDQFITGEVSNHLFEDRRIPFSGVDLIALNIQRARDHGIPSYNNYRALCNLKRARTWEDLSREIPPEVITRFKRIYPTVDDIDLFPGGMSERPLQGGLVGPTFACIIGIQFRQLRKCDRFWYETDEPNLRFTEAQLNEIRKVTLSKIICENMDQPGDMQRAAFDLPSNFLNPRVPCHTMPQMDLSAWRESTVQGCQIGGRNVAVGQSAFPSPCTSCICTNEGAQCASLRITDCAQLSREWSREAILADDICSAQCGLILQSTASSNNIIGLNVASTSRITRSRPIASWSTSFPQAFSLPDLTQFIG